MDEGCITEDSMTSLPDELVNKMGTDEYAAALNEYESKRAKEKALKKAGKEVQPTPQAEAPKESEAVVAKPEEKAAQPEAKSADPAPPEPEAKEEAKTEEVAPSVPPLEAGEAKNEAPKPAEEPAPAAATVAPAATAAQPAATPAEAQKQEEEDELRRRSVRVKKKEKTDSAADALLSLANLASLQPSKKAATAGAAAANVDKRKRVRANEVTPAHLGRPKRPKLNEADGKTPQTRLTAQSAATSATIQGFPDLKNGARHVAIAYYIYYKQRQSMLQALESSGQRAKMPLSLDPTLEARRLKQRTEFLKRVQHHPELLQPFGQNQYPQTATTTQGSSGYSGVPTQQQQGASQQFVQQGQSQAGHSQHQQQLLRQQALALQLQAQQQAQAAAAAARTHQQMSASTAQQAVTTKAEVQSSAAVTAMPQPTAKVQPQPQAQPKPPVVVQQPVKVVQKPVQQKEQMGYSQQEQQPMYVQQQQEQQFVSPQGTGNNMAMGARAGSFMGGFQMDPSNPLFAQMMNQGALQNAFNRQLAALQQQQVMAQQAMSQTHGNSSRSQQFQGHGQQMRQQNSGLSSAQLQTAQTHLLLQLQAQQLRQAQLHAQLQAQHSQLGLLQNIPGVNMSPLQRVQLQQQLQMQQQVLAMQQAQAQQAVSRAQQQRGDSGVPVPPKGVPPKQNGPVPK